MAKLKRNKRAFRHASGLRIGRLILGISVFLLLCFILSVTVGLVLGRRAEEAYVSKTFDLDAKPYASGNKTVPVVDAYLLPPDADPHNYTGRGVTDLSFCLRDREGNLPYVIDLSFEGEDSEMADTALLTERAAEIQRAGGRACAYFYVTSFAVTDPYLRELQAAYEIALVNRAAKAGVDEILLVGLPFDEESIDAVEAYVSKMSFAAEQALLGVLMAPEVFQLSEEDLYWAARVRSVCDFAAIDLRGLPGDADEIMVGNVENSSESGSESEAESGEGEKCSLLDRTLEEYEYYIKSGQLRIVLSSENAALYDALKAAGAENLQIIGN